MFKIGDRVKVKVTNSVICEYWNIPGTVTDNFLLSVWKDGIYSTEYAVRLDFSPFSDMYTGDNYFTESELACIK